MNFLGLGFSQPLILWGLLACAIPIILNLINLQRFKKVRWAAMEFLMKAIEKNRRKIKIQNLLLLLLRILLIAAVVFALSQPYLKGSNPLSAALSSKSNIVIVIDNSYSMGAYWGNKTYFDRAKEVARKLVEDREVGDRVAIMVINESCKVISEPRVIAQQGNTKESLLGMINDLQLSDYPSNYNRMFSKLPPLLGKFEDTPSLEKAQYLKKIYFISDNQRVGWKEKPSAKFLEPLKKQQVVFYLQDVGTDQGNLSVTDFGIREGVARVGIPFQFRLKIKNYSKEDVEGAFLSLKVIHSEDYSHSDEKEDRWNSTNVTFNIYSGQEKTLVLPSISLKKEGLYRAQVQIQQETASTTDALLRDNSRYFVFEVKSSLKILLVDGDPGEPSETDFLKLAFNPTLLEKKVDPSQFDPIVKRKLRTEDIEKFDVIVLANYAGPSPALLKNFLAKGGSLIVFLGTKFGEKFLLPSQVDQLKKMGLKVDIVGPGGKDKRVYYPAQKFYNQLLYEKGDGLLPARIEWKDRKIHANLNPRNYDHPIFDFFQNHKDIITSPRFYKYSDLKAASGAEVLATFTDESNTPALVEKKYKAGRVLLCNFSADRDWTNFPISQSYLIFFRHLVQYVAKKGKTARNYQIGEAINLSGPEKKGDIYNSYLITPLGEEIPDPLMEGEKEIVLNPQVVNRAGIYEVQWRVAKSVYDRNYLSLNLNPREGDLDRLLQEELGDYLPGLTYGYQQALEGVGDELEAEEALPNNQLWMHFMGLALLFLFLETLLAYIFGSKRR